VQCRPYLLVAQASEQLGGLGLDQYRGLLRYATPGELPALEGVTGLVMVAEKGYQADAVQVRAGLPVSVKAVRGRDEPG
jgi:hypothetical protein